MSKIQICGVAVDTLTANEALEIALKEKKKDAKAVCTVFTPNALMLRACRRDPSLTSLLNQATLSLPDGAGVVMAARRKGTPLRERVSGIDFGYALLERAEKEGLRVFFLGGRPGVAEEAAERLQKRLPSLSVCGTHHGYFEATGEENRRILERIRESRAELLFVCLGFPRQERWTESNRSELAGLRVIACLGGSLDIWAGRQRRAPQILQSLGCEWAWRMLREPRRLGGLPALIQFWVLSLLGRL